MKHFDSTQSNKFNNETIRLRQKLKVALVKPPLSGHIDRGTGIYAKNLYGAYKLISDIDTDLIDFGKNIDSYDIVHYPYFDPFFLTLPFIKRRPTIVTIHDLIPLKFPQFPPKGFRGEVKWQIQKMALKSCRAIITDSNASKEDIAKFTKTEKDRIHTIYLGVSKEFHIVKSLPKLKEVKSKLKLPDKFILYVGDVNYNKNIEGIISAFSIISQTYPIDLILVGKGFIIPSREISNIKKLITALNLTGRIHLLGHVDLEDLIGLYNLAKVYLEPSLAEGFGLPVLEAMACGCPVVAGNKTSLVEIAGKAAVLVDPYKVDEITDGLIRILNLDASSYKGIVKKGLEQVKKFSWEKCAGETVKVYKRALFNN